MEIVFLRASRAAAFACLCLLLTGCLSMKSYVDTALPVVSKGELVRPANPQPAQVLFEFRTKGNANAKATDQLRGRVLASIVESQMFGTLNATPDGDSPAVLKVVIDNVPITDNAAAKGFGTGLTFGLAGSIVTDGYVCEATYQRAGKTTSTTVKHALHTTIGNHSGVKGVPAMQTQDALNQVIDQLVLNALKNLDAQSAFAGE